MPDPMHFDRVADTYSQVRPAYPDALWEDVLATGLVAPGRRALDLGAGTGEATGELLKRGMRVVAVEPGQQLAAILRRRFPTAVLQAVRAEDMDVELGSCDVAVAATSFHWMDLDVVLPLIHRGLARHGRLLLWRNVFGDPDASITPFRQAVARIVSRRDIHRQGNPESAEPIAEALEQSAHFAVRSIHHYRWSINLDTKEILGLFGTFSDWTPKEVDEAARAATALGGTVLEHYTSWLIVAAPV